MLCCRWGVQDCIESRSASVEARCADTASVPMQVGVVCQHGVHCNIQACNLAVSLSNFSQVGACQDLSDTEGTLSNATLVSSAAHGQ
jgi:hypothetical protein